MKKYKFYIIFIGFLFILNSCTSLSEGMTGSKRSKSSDEFFVHKKKPLVVPPDFEDMPSPTYFEKKDKKTPTLNEAKTIEDLLNINKKNSKNLESTDNSSLNQSILKKIRQN